MITYKDYYLNQFRNDLNEFFSKIPDESKFHNDLERKQIFTIQNSTIKANSKYLDFMSHASKEHFGVALFFTILVDMVCFTLFNSHYKLFQSLTRYPKYIGDCPGGCRYHFEPSMLFINMNSNRNDLSDSLNFRDIFKEASIFMQIETNAFIEEYIPNINPSEFWTKCEKNFPFYF